MEEIDDMLNHWIYNSIIRAKLRELIIKRIKEMKKEYRGNNGNKMRRR